MGINIGCTHGAKAILVAEEISHWHDRHGVGVARCGIDVLGVMGLVAIGSREGAASSIDLAIPPIVAIRRKDVGSIRWADVCARSAEAYGIILEGSGEVTIRDDCPFEAFFDQYLYHAFAKRAFGRPKAFGIGGIVAESLFVYMSMRLDFLSQYIVGNQGAEYVVEGECCEIHSGIAPRSLPTPRCYKIVLPAIAIAPLSIGREAIYIFNQTTRIVHLRPSFGIGHEGLDGIFTTMLVGGDSIGLAKNLLEIV